MDFIFIGAVSLPDAAPWLQGLSLLFAFLIGHALADFPLQGKFLAVAKERDGELQNLTGAAWPRGMWIYCLTMHSLIHAGAVWVIGGCVRLAALELALHWAIDFGKTCRWTNFYLDQSLHVACKLVYVYLLLG